MNLFGAEAGYDWLFREDEPTKLYAGVMIGIVGAGGIKTKKDNGAYDKGKGEAPGVGVYATLVNDEQWFIDIAARNFWTRLDMTNHASNGNLLTYRPERNIFAASVELGKNLKSELGNNDYFRLEPKVELGLMRAAGSEAKVSNGNMLKYKGANYANVKAGVLLSYNTHLDNGMLLEPLLELAYRYELLGKDTVTYNGVSERSDLSGGTLEFNAGLNMQLADNLYWYGVGSYEKNGKVTGWGLHAGIRYSFGGGSTSVGKTSTRSYYEEEKPTKRKKSYYEEEKPSTRKESYYEEEKPTKRKKSEYRKTTTTKKSGKRLWNPLGDDYEYPDSSTGTERVNTQRKRREYRWPQTKPTYDTSRKAAKAYADYPAEDMTPGYSTQSYSYSSYSSSSQTEAPAYKTRSLYETPEREVPTTSYSQQRKVKTTAKSTTKQGAKKKNAKPRRFKMIDGVPVEQ